MGPLIIAGIGWIFFATLTYLLARYVARRFVKRHDDRIQGRDNAEKICMACKHRCDAATSLYTGREWIHETCNQNLKP